MSDAPIRINLALQGGGAHGAFTWGVLDRLLDEDDVEIAGISGTSAGALNGAALKAGMLSGGREGARERLDALWARMGALPDDAVAEWFAGIMPDAGQVARWLEVSPGYQALDAVARGTSPYGWGALYRNPLADVVAGFEMDKVQAAEGCRFFVSATNVRTGKIRVFEREWITTEAILASACLPTLFQAVECWDPETRTREAYWDGGYAGNPALFPLFYDPDLPADVVIVNINPLYRGEVPKSAPAILNRINEISFNQSLLSELRAIAFASRLVHDGKVGAGDLKDMLVHMIADDTLMTRLSEATKIVPVSSVMAELKAAGRRAAANFLTEHKASLGQRATVHLPTLVG